MFIINARNKKSLFKKIIKNKILNVQNCRKLILCFFDKITSLLGNTLFVSQFFEIDILRHNEVAELVH